MPTCFLCEKQTKNLENHHLIPGFLVRIDGFEKWKNSGGKIQLCTECHKKVTSMMKPLEIVLKKELNGEVE